MKKILRALLAILILLNASLASATTVSFTDSVIFWPGFSDASNHNGQNTQDVIGDPQITGGSFIFQGHTLTGINLNYTSTSSVLVPADFFFDLNNDKKWDYVLHNSNTAVGGVNAYKLFNVSSLNLSINDVSIYDLSSWPDGYYGRYNHPVRIDARELSGLTGASATFGGWITAPSNMPGSGATASWSGLSIDMDAIEGQPFTYAFAMLCANDVLYGQVNAPAPEPGTMVLMGLGVVAAAVMRKRMRKAV